MATPFEDGHRQAVEGVGARIQVAAAGSGRFPAATTSKLQWWQGELGRWRGNELGLWRGSPAKRQAKGMSQAVGACSGVKQDARPARGRVRLPSHWSRRRLAWELRLRGGGGMHGPAQAHMVLVGLPGARAGRRRSRWETWERGDSGLARLRFLFLHRRLSIYRQGARLGGFWGGFGPPIVIQRSNHRCGVGGLLWDV